MRVGRETNFLQPGELSPQNAGAAPPKTVSDKIFIRLSTTFAEKKKILKTFEPTYIYFLCPSRYMLHNDIRNDIKLVIYEVRESYQFEENSLQLKAST